MKCLLCKKAKARKRYCSTICIKRAWLARKNPNSIFNNSPEFWKTETGKAVYWEKWAARRLGAKHLMFNRNLGDLDWNGKIIDVKVCNLYKRKLKRGQPTKNIFGNWVFNRNKPKNIDYFLCICLIGKKIEKILLIPNNEFPKIGLTIGKKSYFDKFHLNNQLTKN